MDITTYIYLILTGIDLSLGLIYTNMNKKEIAIIWFILAIINFITSILYFYTNNKKPPMGSAY